MSQELTKELMCLCLKNGIEIWIEKEKLDAITPLLETKRFININGNIINTESIMGVFLAKEMEEKSHRKNGEWKCDFGFWHKRYEECGHNL
jgi:hypothetical protein